MGRQEVWREPRSRMAELRFHLADQKRTGEEQRHAQDHQDRLGRVGWRTIWQCGGEKLGQHDEADEQ